MKVGEISASVDNISRAMQGTVLITLVVDNNQATILEIKRVERDIDIASIPPPPKP
jgi:hypothetical protein